MRIADKLSARHFIDLQGALHLHTDERNEPEVAIPAAGAENATQADYAPFSCWHVVAGTPGICEVSMGTIVVQSEPLRFLCSM